MVNIPIYRAKKIDGDELVYGYLCKDILNLEEYVIFPEPFSDIPHINAIPCKIDQNTLAIHFPNMIDKKGKKIFASLSEDGIGGDNISFEGSIGAFKYDNGEFLALTVDGLIKIHLLKHCEAIGIHKANQ